MKLAIFIPTHNRPDCIRYYLERQYENCVKYKIHIFIYDSSSNNFTQSVVREFLVKNNEEFLTYKTFEENSSTPARAQEFVKEYMSEYDYMWTCGDGIVLKINEIFPVVNLYMEKNYDVIHLDNRDCFQVGTKEYTDAKLFFKECFWKLTHYGASVIPRRVAEYYLKDELLFEKYGGTGYALQAGIMEYCANSIDNIHCVHYVTDFIEYNPYKTASDWNDKIIWQWINRWCYAIDRMPDVYNQDKNYVIKSIHKANRFFDLHGTIHLKLAGALRREEVVQNKKDFKRCVGNRYYVIWVICEMPGSIINMFKHVYNACKHIKNAVKRNMIDKHKRGASCIIQTRNSEKGG